MTFKKKREPGNSRTLGKGELKGIPLFNKREILGLLFCLLCRAYLLKVEADARSSSSST